MPEYEDTIDLIRHHNPPMSTVSRLFCSLRELHRSQAWSLELRLELLQHGVNASALLLTTFSIYELAERETAIVATAPFSSDVDWRREAPALAAIADRERDRIARMLERLQHASRSRTIAPPAA